MPIDIICAVAFLYGFWKGYNQGIISTVFNVLAYVFGIVLAFKMTPTATNILEQLFNSTNPMMFIAAFTVNVVFIMFVIRQAAKGFEGILQTLYIGVINQALGGAVLGMFGILIVSVLVWFGDKTGMVSQQTKLESQTYETLIKLPGKAKTAAERFKPFALEAWETSVTWMDRLQKYGEKETGGKTDQPRIYELPDNGNSGIETDPQESDSRQRSGSTDEGSGIEDY